MARKKVREYDSKCLFRENPMRLAGINLQILSTQPTIASAHRTPERLYNFALSAKERGFEVIIAGASGAAQLPGMVASLTSVPVTGVPIKTSSLDGLDSLLSIVQGWWLH